MENLSFVPSKPESNNTTTSLTWIYSEQTDLKEILFFTFLGILIIFENTTSILVFWRQRFVLKRSTILLINLTTADLLVGFAIVSAMVGEFLPQDGKTSIKDVHFKVTVQFDAFAGLSSIFFLAAISVEKSHSIVRPLRHAVMVTRCYVIGVCLVWLLTGVLSGLILLSLFDYLDDQFIDIVISSFIGLALLITCVSYTTIWLKFSRGVFIPCTAASEMNKKLAKTLFIITVLSLVSWLPFHVIFLLLHLFPDVPISDSAVIITRLLQFANSLLNPIVYNLRMPEFRKAMKKLICGCVIRHRHNVEIRLVSLKKH